MYANVITRHSGNSTLNPTPTPSPFGAPPHRAPHHGPARRRTTCCPPGRPAPAPPRPADTTPTTSGPSAPPAQASEAPRIPPRLYAAWNPSMMLRPYDRCRLTPSMFIEASNAPTASPNTASATASTAIRSPAPTPSSANSTTGWDQRSNRLGRTRRTRRPVTTLPTPARIGTAAREDGQQRVGDAVPVLDGRDARDEQSESDTLGEEAERQRDPAAPQHISHGGERRAPAYPVGRSSQR